MTATSVLTVIFLSVAFIVIFAVGLYLALGFGDE